MFYEISLCIFIYISERVYMWGLSEKSLYFLLRVAVQTNMFEQPYPNIHSSLLSEPGAKCSSSKGTEG